MKFSSSMSSSPFGASLLSLLAAVAVLCGMVCVSAHPQHVYSRAKSCRRLFNKCELVFDGYTDKIPVWDMSRGAPDVPLTTRIISRNKSEVIGVVNTNENPAQFVYARAVYPITIGKPPLTPTHFKVYPVAIDAEDGIYGSGVGHQTFTGNQAWVVRDKCVRLYVSSYQLLDPKTYYVMSNVNDIPRSANKCVVFYTAK